MEDIGRYAQRKRQELALLARLAGAEALEIPDDAAELFSAKRHLRALLLAAQARRHPELTETERHPGAIHRVGSFRIRYGYSRFDLDVAGPPVYACAPKPRGTLYAVTGMSAIAATLLALDRLGETRLEGLPGCYFETQHLLAELTARLRLDVVAEWTGRGGAAVLVDSYVKANCQRLDRVGTAAPGLVLFDTTCYPANSLRIGAIVRWALERGAGVICLRSHLKLDQLGLEYARLGSAVFFGEGPGLSAIMEAVEDTARTLGVGVPPVLLPPFFGDAEFQRLNTLRLDRLRENCRYALGRLLGLGQAIGRFHHLLFFTVNTGLTLDQLGKAADDLARRLKEAGVPARRSGSFGHDFIAIDDYVDAVTETPVIRCTMADVPRVSVESLVAVVQEWAIKPAS